MLTLADVDAFYGRAHILHALAFEAPRGSVTALLGRNGAGKSTTFKAIMQMVAMRGRIRFGATDITGLPTHEIARLGIGYVPEDRRVFRDLTILENLEVGRRPARDGQRAWTEAALFELFPNLAERRRNLGSQLSGGEQQMLTIARTLMGNPLLLLLDEPSEGIAPVIVEQMASAITRLKGEGMTMLLSEQNLHFAREVADRAVVLESGAVRFTGSFAELDARPDVRDAYLSVA
jgi:branched-chain amino acid transport system ATP-binding protein